MTRSVGLVVLLIALALGGALFAMQNKNQGPTAPAVTHDEAQAVAAAGAEVFAQVDQVLQGDFLQAGTYVGAELPVGSGVTLAQATATSYCLEANVNGTLVHEPGPGGAPAAGSCPAQ